jgi:hypothetical protein
VVGVRVGNQHGVQMLIQPCAPQLHAQFGRRVNQNLRLPLLDVDAGARAVVARVVGGTHGAAATQLRNAHRGAAAQYRDAHGALALLLVVQ